MALDFTGSVTDFIEAIKEIMAMQKLSDFASEEKGKARLNDYTNPFVRLLLLAMPAFLADSEVLLNAVNKEYFDKLFVFVLSWESAKLYFQKESENEAVLEELSKLMQMTARDLLLALEKEGEEKKLNELMAALLSENERRILEEMALRSKQIEGYAWLLYNLSEFKQQLEHRCEERKKEIIEKYVEIYKDPQIDSILKKCGIDPDSDKAQSFREDLAQRRLKHNENEMDKKVKELATSGIPDVQDFLATGDMSAIVIPPKSKVGLFADFDHHKEKKDFALAVQACLEHQGVDTHVAHEEASQLEKTAGSFITAEKAVGGDLLQENAVDKSRIKMVEKSEEAVVQHCAEKLGDGPAERACQLAADNKSKLAARRAARKEGAKKTGLR